MTVVKLYSIDPIKTSNSLTIQEALMTSKYCAVYFLPLISGNFRMPCFDP